MVSVSKLPEEESPPPFNLWDFPGISGSVSVGRWPGWGPLQQDAKSRRRLPTLAQWPAKVIVAGQQSAVSSTAQNTKYSARFTLRFFYLKTERCPNCVNMEIMEKKAIRDAAEKAKAVKDSDVKKPGSKRKAHVFTEGEVNALIYWLGDNEASIAILQLEIV
jgi:hypothetical protein